MDWLKERKRYISELCESCAMFFNEKQKCIYKYTVDFSKTYPCKYILGKKGWKKKYELSLSS